ncbi:MAG: O-antigen ligase family protein [Vampirovibrionales bacterium]|nr:O-antigen ligase family protein [Vampirovibrionales bacterium]
MVSSSPVQERSQLPVGLLRLLALLALILAGPLLAKVLKLPSELPLILWPPVLAVGLWVGTRLLGKSFSNPLVPFCGGFLMYALLGFDMLTLGIAKVSLKPHMLGFGLILAFSLWYLLRDFKYFWTNTPFRLLFIFSAIAFAYYGLDHSTHFQLSDVSAGYPAGNMLSDFGDADARQVVLLVAIGLFTAYTCGLALFNPTFYGVRPSPDADGENLNEAPGFVQPLRDNIALLCKSYPVLVLVFLLWIAANGFKSMLDLYLPLMLFLNYALWWYGTIYMPGATVLPVLRLSLHTWMMLAMVITVLFMPLAVNKTALAGAFIAMGVFYWACRKQGYHMPWRGLGSFLNTGLLPKLMILGALVAAVLMIQLLGFTEVILDKLDYYIKGFENASDGKGTLDVRLQNWHYLFENWGNEINLSNFIFGFGLGESRETIFYISAQRRFNYGILVQTVHNSYIEFFYDYGLTSLFYFGGIFALVIAHFKNFNTLTVPGCSRLFSLMLISMVLYSAIYGLMDGIRVPMMIQLFAFYGFAEGYRQWALRAPSAHSAVDKLTPDTQAILLKRYAV